MYRVKVECLCTRLVMSETRQWILNRRRVGVTAWSWPCPLPAQAGRDSATEIVSTQSLRMKDPNLYEARRGLLRMEAWQKRTVNIRLSFRTRSHPKHSVSSFSSEQEQRMRNQSVLSWGILPQTPWDLTLSRQDSRAREGGWRPRGIPAAESALGSHPCVALSSAQVTPVYTEGEKRKITS
jgi:hypothetical protein